MNSGILSDAIAPAGIAQLTGGRFVVSATTRELNDLRQQFRARASLLLPGFMAPELVARTRARMEEAAFDQEAIPGIGHQSLCTDRTLSAMLHLSVNRPPVFRFLEELTGEGTIRGFEGVLRRYGRDEGHSLGWHNDLNDRTRLLAMSLQLGNEAYDGGRLQVREKDSPDLLAEYGCAAAGDAMLFRIHPSVEHQVTPVVGEAVRTAFIGWFVTRDVPALGAPHSPLRLLPAVAGPRTPVR